MCNQSTLSNTHYLPSGYLSHNRNITSSSGTTTASWMTELPSELKAGQQVGQLHTDLDLFLFHAGIVDTLQHSLHVPLQLRSLCHQLPPPMYLRNCRLIFKTTHQFICLGAVTIVCLELQKVRRVVTRAECRHSPGLDLEGLPVQIWTVFDNGQYERVVHHYNLNIVRLAGDSLSVSDGEVDVAGSFIPHEPNRHNIWPVVGCGVVGSGCRDFSESPDLAVAHGGAIGVTKRGCF